MEAALRGLLLNHGEPANVCCHRRRLTSKVIIIKDANVDKMHRRHHHSSKSATKDEGLALLAWVPYQRLSLLPYLSVEEAGDVIHTQKGGRAGGPELPAAWTAE